jgi:hypothetical protein
MAGLPQPSAFVVDVVLCSFGQRCCSARPNIELLISFRSSAAVTSEAIDRSFARSGRRAMTSSATQQVRRRSTPGA